MATDKQLNKKFVSASKWASVSQIARKAIQPLVFVILAKLLTPDDFGVVAVAAMVISLSEYIWDAGLSKALIYEKENDEVLNNVVFWTNLVLGIVVYLIIFLFASEISTYFKDPRIENAVKVQGLSVLVFAFASVQRALFQKALDFKSLFWVNLLTTTLPALVSVPLAYLGYGYWALIWSSVVGAIIQAITLWYYSKWRPAFRYDWQKLKNIIKFGAWVSGEGVLSWFFIWIDSMFVGHYLGTFDMGLYRTGNYFVSLIFGILLGYLLPVVYSTFTKLREKREEFNKYYYSVVKTIVFIAYPVTFLVFITSNDIEKVVFGTKWHGISEVIMFLVLTHGLSWLVSINRELYRAIGKPKISTLTSIFSIPLFIVFYYVSVQDGLKMFLYTRFILAMIMLPIHLIILGKIAKLSILKIFIEIKWILLFIGLFVIVLSGVKYYYISSIPILNLIIHWIIGMVIYSGIYFIEKDFILKLVKLLLGEKLYTKFFGKTIMEQ